MYTSAMAMTYRESLHPWIMNERLVEYPKPQKVTAKHPCLILNLCACLLYVFIRYMHDSVPQATDPYVFFA